MNTLSSVFTLALALSTASAHAAPTTLSDFFQVWKLSTSGNSDSTCAKTLTGYAEDDIPGVSGIPRISVDSTAKGIRFIPDDTQAPETIILGTHPSTQDDGTSTVTLSDHQLNSVDTMIVGFFRPKVVTVRTDSYTLLPNGGLVVSHQHGDAAATICTYDNAYPDVFGKKEVGAVLFNNGVKIAECTFEPATPPAGQQLYYNEKCSFGKFTIKTVIDDAIRTLSKELVANDKAQEMKIVRSTSLLNSETENWFTRDTETAVIESTVDTIYPADINGYFVSPYQARSYRIEGTHASFQFTYSP